MRISFTRLSFILFLVLIIYGAIWMIRAIWFRPDNIHIFFTRLPYEYASVFPEDISRVNVPQASLLVPYHSFLNEAPQTNSSASSFWAGVQETLNGYQPKDWDPIKEYHYENLLWMSHQLSQSIEKREFYPLYTQSTQFIHLMDRVHQINDKEGAEAYVARLKRFDEKIRRYLDASYVPLDSLSCQTVRNQFIEWLEVAPNQHPLYRAFARKAIAADPTLLNESEAARLLQEVERVITSRISPVFREIVSRLDDQAPRSSFPLGSQSPLTYAQQLELHCSFPISADSLHRAALRSLDSLILAKPDSHVKEVDLPSFEENLDSLNSAITYLKQISAGLFVLEPESSLETALYPEPLPKANHWGRYAFILQEEIGKGQWLVPQTSSSYPPLAYLPAYASYYGIPGLHTLHSAVWKHGTPRYLHRQFLNFPAFEHGWALYASQSLIQDLKAFSYAPAISSGFKHLSKVHLIRCIIDTGIHSKGWTYAEAYSFMKRNLSEKFPIQQELLSMYHRPGIGSATWVGYEKIMQIKRETEAKMGSDFVLQDFHSEILKIGPGTFPAFEKVWWRIIEK